MTEQDAADADEATGADESTNGEGPTEAGGATGEEAAGDEAAGETPADGDDPAGETSTDPATGDTEPGATEGEFDDAPDEDLIERVSASDPEDVAREIASLRARIDGLEGELEARDEEVDELESKLKRKQADFQNFKKRMEKRREEERERAAADLVTRMLDVRDNLVRALEQDEDADIRGGVESTLRQFDDVLDAEGVDVVEPEPGEDVDPHRHEVLVRVESDQPEGTIADVHRPGYVMADSVLREAQVTVSDGSDE